MSITSVSDKVSAAIADISVSKQKESTMIKYIYLFMVMVTRL